MPRRRNSYFQSAPPRHLQRRASRKGPHSPGYRELTIRPVWVGLSANQTSDTTVELGFALHDGNFTIDDAIHHIEIDPNSSPKGQAVIDFILNELEKYSHDHLFKFIGAGVARRLSDLAPQLCTRLWKDLDAVPIVLDVKTFGANGARDPNVPRPVDEQADSAVRKLLQFFGPQNHIRVSIGDRNEVDVDTRGKIHLVDDVGEYRGSVRSPTWDAVLKYSADLRDRHVKIAFFSSTPQGGGVALMRHAIIRFFKFLGVDAKWYIPKPSPAIFRITKNNHNILQGVADPSLRLTNENTQEFTEWIEHNARRYWLTEGGPLAPGGADVIFIDDPQMPGLIPLIKKARPDVPIVYRSHIEIRSDLIEKPGSPQAEVWKYLYDRIQQADLFISHPVQNFVPSMVPMSKVGLLPATTDWLDGLNKPMKEWDLKYYMRAFRSACAEAHASQLDFPNREYIIQIARFDPAKGLHVAVDAYIKLRRRLEEEDTSPVDDSSHLPPQLLLCGHGAVDDPDASIVHDELLEVLNKEEYYPYADDIVVMRVGPSDQILNALMTNSKFAIQLSSREGFEVKVSEALHKGKPIIATRAGGIPLQVQDGKNGFLCDVNDSEAVAARMHDLWTDKDGVYTRLSEYARKSVSDEVGTVGNALSWMYLASKLSTTGGEELKPGGRWINDLAREEAGLPYEPDEPRLPRGDLPLAN